MGNRAIICALGLCLIVPAAFGQRPVIHPEGVVNAASYAGPPGAGATVAPGSIAAIFGKDLAATTLAAGEMPLPASLGGVSVSFDGIPAPLLYVSPAQINVQVPGALEPPYGGAITARVVVSRAETGLTSEPVPVKVALVAPGLSTVPDAGAAPF